MQADQTVRFSASLYRRFTDSLNLQATLADEFLADIEEEDDNPPDDVVVKPEPGEDDLALPDDLIVKMEEDEQQLDPKLLEKLKSENLKSVVKLLRSEGLQSLLRQIAEKSDSRATSSSTGAVESDPEYRLIVHSNQMSVEIGNEIQLCHKWLRDHYSKKFQELESIVINPVDYAKVIKRLGNETVQSRSTSAPPATTLTNDPLLCAVLLQDFSKIDLTGVLPPALVMSVSMTASTVIRDRLPDEQMQRIEEACDELLGLDDARRTILQYIESRMAFIAPNLSHILGSSVAAKLMTAAGGLTTLSKLPATTIQILGSQKKHLSGMAASSVYNVAHAGFIFNCDIVSKSPSVVRVKAVRLVAGKCALAARVDAFKDVPGDATGRKLREEIEKTLEKLLEPPPAKQPKPLPAPDDKVRKRRGGKRTRKIKEKYGMTEVRKLANRMAFGVDAERAEQTYRETGKGYGMLGMNSGSGKVRVNTTEKGLLKRRPGSKTPTAGGSTTSGLATSLAFTPVQGIEFVDPERAAQKVKDANERYFSTTQSFKKVKADAAAAAAAVKFDV